MLLIGRNDNQFNIGGFKVQAEFIEQIIEEIFIRKGRFKPLRLAYWFLGLIFLFIFADMFFLKILNLQDYGDFRTPVNVMLFFTYS